MLSRLGKLFKGGAKAPESTSVLEDEVLQEQEAQPEDPDQLTPGEDGYGLSVLLEGVAGVPDDVSILYYHRAMGMLVAGTESGVVYGYGKACQMMQTAPTPGEPNDVCTISSLSNECILVSYEDNTLVVLKLPLLQHVCELSASWLQGASITCIHVDEPGERGYVYVGTSDGSLSILQFVGASSELRVCEYTANFTDAGLSQRMSLVDVQLCPRDEKYLAMAWGASDEAGGCVTLFDLSRMKAHRSYPTAPLTSLHWDHTGTVLYAGTTTGQLLGMTIDKPGCSELWSAAQERSGFSDDEETAPAVRKLHWLAPQAAMAPSSGCLFILLGTQFGSNAEHLRSVVIGLAPSNTSSSGTMEEVFSMPPLPEEDVVGMRLVPMGLSVAEGVTAASLAASSGSAPGSPTSQGSGCSDSNSALPALLLLTQPSSSGAMEEDYERDTCRQLRLLPCPRGALGGWALEIGTLPEPRPVKEVLVGAGMDGHSCIIAVPATSTDGRPHLLASVCAALASARLEVGANAGGDDDECDDDGDGEPSLTLASAVLPGEAAVSDLLISGDAAGSVCLWTMHAEGGGGVGAWRVSTTLSQSSEPVTMLCADHERGIIASAYAGRVTVFGAYDAVKGESILDVQLVKNIAAIARREARAASTLTSDAEDDDCNDEGEDEDLDFDPRELKALFSVELASVSAMLVLGQATSLFLGTRSGDIFCCCDWHAKTLQPIRYAHALGPTKGAAKKTVGSVVGFTYSTFWLHGLLVPAVYAVFSSGAVVVIHLHTHTVVASCPQSEVVRADLTQSAALVTVLDALLRPLPTPEPFDSYFLRQVHFSSLTAASASFHHVLADTAEAPVPAHGPCRLVVVLHRSVHVYDLSAFAMASRAALLRGEIKEVPLVATAGGECAPSQHFLSRHAVISAALVQTEAPTARGGGGTPSDLQAALCCLDETGVVGVYSLFLLRPLCRARMLRGREPCLGRGAVLPSGRCLAQVGGVLFSATVRSAPGAACAVCFEERAVGGSLNGSVAISLPPPAAHLQSGREEQLMQQREQARKRSTSILAALPSASARIDLDRLFSKTRLQLDKDDLLDAGATAAALGSLAESEEEGDGTARQRKARGTMQDLGETRDALLARGERLAALNVKSDAIQNSAADYAATIRDHRKSLKQKASRWGLF